jgi:TonB-dependent receptor
MKTLKLSARLLCSSAVVLFATDTAAMAAAQSGGSSGGGSALEFVVVTGTRQQAVQTKRDAPNVIEVQSLQSIRALPDITAAEALQRIPGISMEADSGEGRFINIRGMDADLNSTTWDGVHLTASNPATPQGGGRAVAFDAFPSGILGGIVVTKSLTPEMDAEGLGGSVNILPRAMASGQDWMVDASAGGGLEPLRNSPVWQGDVTAGTRSGMFSDDDRITIIASYAFHEDWRGVDDIEEDYANPAPDKTFRDLQNRWYRYHRTRQGFGGSFTFDITDNTQVYVRGLHAGYTEIANKQYLRLNGLDSVTGTSPNGDITVNMADPEIDVTDTKEDVANNVVEFGGSTVVADDVKMDLKGSWTRGTDAFPRGDGFSFLETDPVGNPAQVSLVYNNVDPRFPSYHTTDGTNLQDPTIYTAAGFSGSDSRSKNHDEEWAGRYNVSFPFPISDYEGELKFGVSGRWRQVGATSSNANFDPIPAGQTYADYSVPNFFRVYYQAHYNVGQSTLYNKLAALPEGPQVDQPTAFQDNNEDVYAVYGQYSGTFDDLTVVGGLRVERTRATYRAISQDANTGALFPSTAKSDYTDFFPDVNFRYQLWDDFVLRLAYSTGIARPGFNQITAAKTVDLVNLILTEGNPNLKPTTGQNLDLSAEYYDDEGGTASIGLFQKWFSDYIIPTDLLNVPNIPNPEFPSAGPPTFTGEIQSFENIGSAQANGVELSASKQFMFLPEGWNGLGLEGNVTFVGSRGQIRLGENHTLPQTSPINYNAAVFYQWGPFNLKLAASYVSRNIFSVGGDASGDVYSQPRLRIDFGGSYMITDNIEYYLDLKNLSNTKLEFTQTPDKNFPIQREFYDATYLTGIRIKLGP